MIRTHSTNMYLMRYAFSTHCLVHLYHKVESDLIMCGILMYIHISKTEYDKLPTFIRLFSAVHLHCKCF